MEQFDWCCRIVFVRSRPGERLVQSYRKRSCLCLCFSPLSTPVDPADDSWINPLYILYIRRLLWLDAGVKCWRLLPGYVISCWCFHWVSSINNMEEKCLYVKHDAITTSTIIIATNRHGKSKPPPYDNNRLHRRPQASALFFLLAQAVMFVPRTLIFLLLLISVVVTLICFSNNTPSL